MSPVDWSEHRQPRMYFGDRRLWPLRLLPILVLVVVLFQTDRTYRLVAIVGAALIASICAFLIERRYRRRKAFMRFGSLGTAVMLTMIWALVFGFELFFLYYPYTPRSG